MFSRERKYKKLKTDKQVILEGRTSMLADQFMKEHKQKLTFPSAVTHQVIVSSSSYITITFAFLYEKHLH